MGTKSIESFKKKYFPAEKDKKEEKIKQFLKQSLETLTIKQLKSLAEKHRIKVKGSIVEELFDSHRAAPTKKQYINQVSGIVTQKEINSLPKQTPPKPKKKKKTKSDDSWF